MAKNVKARRKRPDNSDCHVGQLVRLKQKILKLRLFMWKKKVLLHQENAPCHEWWQNTLVLFIFGTNLCIQNLFCFCFVYITFIYERKHLMIPIHIVFGTLCSCRSFGLLLGPYTWCLWRCPTVFDSFFLRSSVYSLFFVHIGNFICLVLSIPGKRFFIHHMRRQLMCEQTQHG